MGRSERPLDPSSSPLHAFAAQLRDLRVAAGKPTYEVMEKAVGRSRSVLADAASGNKAPSWATVEAYVRACKGDPDDWKGRWEALADQLREKPESPIAPPEIEDEPAPRRRANTGLLLTGSFVVGLGIGVGATLLMLDDGPEPTSFPSEQVEAVVITVQNMVALGADELIEDATPSFLSTVAEPYCANNDCKLEGSEVASGAKFVAVCHVTGTEMFNYNLDSSESRSNAHRARSSLWYMAELPDGRTGYISEVYIAPEDRGGKGLAECEA